MSHAKEPYRFSHLAETMIGDLRGIPFSEPEKMRRRATKNLAPIVEELLVKFHVGQNSPEHSIREKWAEMVGHANASFSHPVSIDPKNCLIVHVSHAIVRGELNLHRIRLLAQVKAITGCSHIRDIRFRAG